MILIINKLEILKVYKKYIYRLDFKRIIIRGRVLKEEKKRNYKLMIIIIFLFFFR